MYKVFLSSSIRDLAEYRLKIFEELNNEFKMIGVENIIPSGSNSQELTIANLKDCDIVIFIISSYYGTYIADCKLKEECKAQCPMKTRPEHISYRHCEYKTTVAENKPHITYLVESWEDFWDHIDTSEGSEGMRMFCSEFMKEFYFYIDIEDQNSVKTIREHLTENILKWECEERLFKKYNIFLSYATKDSDQFQISKIAQCLKQFPDIENVFYWEKDSGQSIVKYMNENIESSEVFILFCTQNSKKSRAVEIEWNTALQLAQEDKIRIIPVFQGVSDIPVILKTFLGVEYIRNNFKEFIAKLHEECLRR